MSNKKTPIVDLPAFQNLSPEERDKILATMEVCHIKTVEDLKKISKNLEKTMKTMKAAINTALKNLPSK